MVDGVDLLVWVVALLLIVYPGYRFFRERILKPDVTPR